MAMTKDDIIRMAEKAGMERCKCDPRCHLHTGGMGSLTYFADLVAAAEREACAEVCKEWLHGEWHNQGVVAAAMIRARGQHD